MIRIGSYLVEVEVIETTVLNDKVVVFIVFAIENQTIVINYKIEIVDIKRIGVVEHKIYILICRFFQKTFIYIYNLFCK